MKKNLLIIISLCCSLSVSAQSYQEWLKQQQDGMKKFADEKEAGISSLAKEYSDYVIKRDQEFSDYLKKRWNEYKNNSPETPISSPKPITPPIIENQPASMSTIVLKTGNTVEDVNDVPDAVPTVRLKKSINVGYSTQNITVNFYGEKISLRPDRKLCSNFTGSLQEGNFSSYWSNMSSTNYDDFIDALFAYKERLALNDWGYYMLVKACAKRMTNNENSVEMLCWFILNKSGYRTRIGYANNKISLLVPTRQDVYRLSYLTLGGLRYYITRPLEGGVYTYDKDFSGSDQIFDLRFSASPNFSSTEPAVRTLKMDDKTFSIAYNPSVAKFYDDYPFTVLSVYFDAPVSATLKESLIEQLSGEMSELSATEKAEWLLKFMHKVFPYKTDNDQFGREKYFFAEEMFLYPFSDCEDRAVLYTYLTKTFADLSCIGLSYPGHVSAAIALPASVGGYYFMWQNQAYTVFDPTYFGAKGGMCMPEYTNKTADIIPQNGRFISTQRENQIIQMIADAGGILPSNSRHLQLDDQGNVYACGIFEKDFSYEKETLTSNGQRQIFVTKITPQNKFQWGVAMNGNGDNYPEQIRLNNDLLYLIGEFDGYVSMGGFQLKAQNGRDLFLAGISSGGTVLWTSSAGIAPENKEQAWNYIVRFDSKGSVLKNDLYPAENSDAEAALTITPRNELIISGSIKEERPQALAPCQNPLVLNTIESNTATTISNTDMIKNLTDQYLSKDTERGVAGLFAVISSIIEDKRSISGVDAIKALDKYNPNFKTRCPMIYENIALIDFIKDDSGILNMRTVNGQTVNFDKLQVTNGSKMRINKTSDSNYKIEVLNGITVGKAFIRFRLNEITLYGKTGDMLIDYDSDHTRRTFNFTNDILN